MAVSDHVAQVWDARTGKPLGNNITHGQKINHASFSPDGSWVLTASDDETARLSDAASGKSVRELAHSSPVNHASFDSKGTRVVTASKDRYARIWDAKTGAMLAKPLWHSDPVLKASFSTDDKLIMTTSLEFDPASVLEFESGRFDLWLAGTGERLRTIGAHRGRVNHASFSPDGLWLATASNDQTARIWKVPAPVNPAGTRSPRSPRSPGSKQRCSARSSRPSRATLRCRHPSGSGAEAGYRNGARIAAATGLCSAADAADRLAECRGTWPR